MSEENKNIAVDNEFMSFIKLSPEERAIEFLEKLTKMSRKYQLKIEKIDDGRVVLKEFSTIGDCALKYVLDSNGSLSSELDVDLLEKLKPDIYEINISFEDENT